MARPREHGAETREALLRAAGRVLREEGAGALSVRRLAEDVEVSTRAIYSLFDGKDGLVRAMFREGFDGLAAALEDASATTDDPLDRLVALGHAYRRSALDRPHLYTVMFDCPVPEFAPTEEDDAVAIGALHQLRGAIAAAVEAGVVAADVEDVTFAFWGYAHGMVSLELAGTPPGLDTDRVYAAGLEAIVEGFAARG